MDDKNKKLNNNFTIILPALNEARTILKTVAEALKTGASEIIIVDDGSTDAMVSVLGPVLKLNPQLKLISHSRNLGSGAARKTGILAATNSTLLFFDSDIENIHSEMMTKLVAPILKNEADFVMASFENFGRVTEYLVKPLLLNLLPDLAHLNQPLSGMFAIRRHYINPEKIKPGYSIAGILLDVYFNGARITQADIGVITHRHRLDIAKRDHAMTACKCILDTLSEKGILRINNQTQ